MNIHDFQAKWRESPLKERSAAQEHFIDLCRALGMPTPADVDREGSFYTFEKGAAKTAGGQGFADVWWRGHFGWEYKGQRANLDAAYQQLLQYREDLENPPLLVVCDLHTFQVHTNFTGTIKQVHTFTVDELHEPETLAILRAVFTEPERLRPERTIEGVTREAAERFGALALALAGRGVEPERAAHFLMQLLFCMFSEDIGLLPKGLFSRLLEFGARYPQQFTPQAEALFLAMRDGGFFHMEAITHFNGGLFAEIDVLPLTADDLRGLSETSRLDWASVEPAIFGTLFERSLDPAKRSQLGAHYTGRADIERVVEPVVMAPLRRRWEVVRAEAATLKAAWDSASTTPERNRRRQAFANRLFAFQEELAALTILDPACGSGNFLYVALTAMKDLEKEVGLFGAANGLPMMFPRVSPAQLYGLEVNQYAQQLAQVVVWIGYLQWMTANGFQPNRDPVLEPLDTIRLQDALLSRENPTPQPPPPRGEGEQGSDGSAADLATHALDSQSPNSQSPPLPLGEGAGGWGPREAAWPAADIIIGNPPFLGVRRLRSELGNEYVEDLFQAFDGRVARESDLVCYFFEQARAQIASGRTTRAGLLATNSIRGGANRRVLERIRETGDIFMAWSDEPWILDGAAVRISIVGFDSGDDSLRMLNGVPVSAINPDLTGSLDITIARRLAENSGISFMADIKGGPFDIPGDVARHWLSLPPNPNGHRNSDVVRRWANGLDISRRPRDMWIIDFGVDMPEHQAALYEAPYEYALVHVKPMRDANRRERRRRLWWIHAETHPAMREKLRPLTRYIVTPTVAKHRLFAWLDADVLADHQLIVFARDDDYFFGVLHSRAHEVWSLRMGTWLGKGNDPRYTPTTTFETFPFPRPSDEQREAIGAAAQRLDELRRNWLNPEGASEAELKKRTLTNLYNARPTWLANAHVTLDRAVWAAYGWDDDPAETEEDAILSRLLALNLERAAVT